MKVKYKEKTTQTYTLTLSGKEYSEIHFALFHIISELDDKDEQAYFQKLYETMTLKAVETK